MSHPPLRIAERAADRIFCLPLSFVFVSECFVGDKRLKPQGRVIQLLLRDMSTEETILSRLFALQDLKYREFHCRLMPTVNPECVIGVRTPALRKLAKELSKTPEAAEFLQDLPHRYYEENNLHGFLIETIRDYDSAVAAVDDFLPYIDNWATCDLISPGIFRKHLPELLERIRVWTACERTYTVRFGIGMLMSFYLDEEFRPELLTIPADVRSEEYYVNM